MSGVHGVQGWVKVYSFTDPRERLLDYRPWYVGPGRRRVEVSAARRQGKALTALLEGVADRDAARALVGEEIAVRRDQLPGLNEGDYYWHDLVGLEVRNRGGHQLGRVTRLMETGANDVLVVTGEREWLVPWVPGYYVLKVDLPAGVLVVDWELDD